MIEKCSIGNMTNNIQNITLILLILILIIVIIYYLKNSNAKHNELIEKYTTTPIESSDASYITHYSANSQRNSNFPSTGTTVTLRDCQVQFNNTFDGNENSTVKYTYGDEWKEIDTLTEPGSSPIRIPEKIISRSNETNAADITNYSERTKCFRRMTASDNKYRYAGNNLIQYRAGSASEQGLHSELKVGANGTPENYMEMKFNLAPSNSTNYYNNLTSSICSLQYTNNLGGNNGSGLGGVSLYRLTLDTNNKITAINQITINSTNNHIFTVSSTTSFADLLTSTNTISYVYSGGNFYFQSNSSLSSETNLIGVKIYKFNRELLCSHVQNNIKSYQIFDNKKIDANKIVNVSAASVSQVINSTSFPNAAISYASKNAVKTAIEQRINTEIATANTQAISDEKDANDDITTRTAERDVFLTDINTKEKYLDKIFDTTLDASKKGFLVSTSGLITGLELDKLGYQTEDVSSSETILTSRQEPLFSNSQGGDIYTIEAYTDTTREHTKTFNTNTVCDILIVGGGGGGSVGHGGGGGAGQLVFINNAILNGTYTIKVGKGGNGSTASGDNNSMGTITNGTKGSNSEFGSVIAEGGGISVNTTLRDGGSGAGGDGHLADGGVAGKGLKNATVYTFSSGTVYSRGNNGGDGSAVSSGNVGQGGGGGGAGTAGTAGGLNNDSAIGHGGDGLSGISEINYDFKTNFGNYGKLEADGKYWFAGGGAGGVYYLNSSVVSNGGKGGGASTPASVAYEKINGGNGINGTGGGGAGGSAWYGNGGKGGSGIVIIKYRNVPEQNENEKQITLTYNLNNSIVHDSIVYDFSIFKDLTSWKNYATSIGAKNNLTDGFFHIYDGVFVSDRFIGFFELTLPSSYNTITVSFTNGHSDYKDDKDNLVNLKINGDIKATAKSSETITYTQIYSAGDILRIEEIWSFIRNLKITLENRKLYYKATFPISTDVTINGNKAKFDAGTYDIIMGPSSSEIRNRTSKILFGNYENRYGYKLEFKYPITKTLQQLHDDSTSFSGTIYTIGMSDQKYSLGNKTSGTIKKYRVYIYKRLLNHTIELYANNTLLKKGTDYITGNDEDAVPKTINLRNLYITINKNIAGIIYLKSDKPIFFISEINRTSFNNTTDAIFGTNVNNLKASGSGTLSSLNDIFRVSEANTELTTAQNKKITYNINTILESPLTISYNNSTINTTNPAGKNSLDNLMTTYNNIHRYNESSGGALTEKINEYTFGNILNPVETDIEKYISYEYPTAPTDDKLTPSSRNTPFNIRSNATKYVYFRKSS